MYSKHIEKCSFLLFSAHLDQFWHGFVLNPVGVVSILYVEGDSYARLGSGANLYKLLQLKTNSQMHPK